MQWIEFLRSKLFWSIALAVTLLHGAVFFAIKDVQMFDYTSKMFVKYLPTTFFVFEKKPVIEDGLLLEPGEVIYTVPSELQEVSAKRSKPETPAEVSQTRLNGLPIKG